MFSEPSSEADDKLFEDALRLTGNVYLPFVYQSLYFDKKDVLKPLARFSSYAKGVGAANIFPDIDGTIRRMPLVFLEKEGSLSLHVALKIAMDYLGLVIKELRPDRIILSSSNKEVMIPLAGNYRMLINWPGRWQDAFKHYSFLDVLAGYKDYVDNKQAAINIKDFKDSVCLVGITAIGLYDIKPIPIEPEYPGIGIMASSVSNILDSSFLRTPPRWLDILIIYLLALVASLLIRGEKLLGEIFLVFTLGAAYYYAHIFLFTKNIFIDPVASLSAFFVSYFAIETYNFICVTIERQKLLKMSITDELTGLYNIRYFRTILDAAIAHAKVDPNKTFSMVMVDVDHFKQFNDNYGHQVGDLVLKELGHILKNSVRAVDIVARYGGEEMAALLRGTPLKDGLVIAEKMRRNVESYVIKDRAGTYNMTISLGVSAFQKGDNADIVIKRADEGLYMAKQSGRNRVSSVEGQ